MPVILCSIRGKYGTRADDFGSEIWRRIGELVGSGPAVDRLKTIESAEIGFEEDERKEFKLQVDLMNRLQAAVNSWVVENNLEFERPKFITYMSEELHARRRTGFEHSTSLEKMV